MTFDPEVVYNAERAAISFLITDTVVALTLADIALGAPVDSEKRKRNRANARHAYDSVVQLSRKVSCRPQERELLAEKIDQLRSSLKRLGENF